MIMKKLAILFIFLLAGEAYAQTFEGSLHWTLKMEITDPQRKAQMEEAQKKMNDPATQAQMKQMQAKMEDPQFKAMLESNPQMKAQIMQAISAMQSGNLNSLFPTGISIKLKNNNALTQIEGGALALETLYLKEKNQTYSLDRKNKTYSVMKATDKTESPTDSDVKVTKTSETAKIASYNCTKYIVEVKTNGETVTEFIWATSEIKGLDLKSFGDQGMGKNYKLHLDKIDGVPLRVEMKTKEMAMNMEVNEVKKETLSASMFAIPADFKELPSAFGK
jgi:hypothetical protein